MARKDASMDEVAASEHAHPSMPIDTTKQALRDLQTLADEMVASQTVLWCEITRVNRRGLPRLVAAAGTKTDEPDEPPAVELPIPDHPGWYVKVCSGGTNAQLVAQLINEKLRSAVLTNALYTERQLAAELLHRDRDTGLGTQDSLQRWLGRQHGDVTLCIIELASLREHALTISDDEQRNLLRAVATSLGVQVAKTFHHGTLARLGTSEFAIGVPKLVPPVHMRTFVQDCRSAILDVAGLDIYAGWASSEDVRGTGVSLEKAALVARFCAAKHLPGTAMPYAGEVADEHARHTKLANGLSTALASREITYHYQPQVDLSSGAVVGVEALLRWADHQPTDVIDAIMERKSLGVSLGRYLLEHARETVERLPSGITLSVNVTAQHLFGSLSDDLRALEFPRDRLVIEITEMTAVIDLEHAAQVARDCADIGIHVSLDDYGTGFSSLSMYTSLPVAELKLDQSFVASMHSERPAFDVVTSLAQLSRLGSIRVVAEGVESLTQAATWRRLGGNLVQGFLVALPLPWDELCRFIERGSPVVVTTPQWCIEDAVLLEPQLKERGPEYEQWRARLHQWAVSHGAERWSQLAELWQLASLTDPARSETSGTLIAAVHALIERIDASLVGATLARASEIRHY